MIPNLTKKDIQQILNSQTKELKGYVDQRLETNTKDLKGYIDERLNTQSKELKEYTDQQTETLARIVSKAFEKQNEYLDKRFADLEKKLDFRKTLEEHERKLLKLEHALNMKL